MRNLLPTLLLPLLVAAPALAQETKGEDPEKVLAAALKDVKVTDDDNIRVAALMALAEFGEKAAPAVPDLLAALQTKNEDVRLNAAIALGKIGSAATKPVAGLLNSSDDDTRFYAVWAIAGIGPDARETAPAIIRLTKDKKEDIRRKAVYALGRLAGDAKETIAVLVTAFSDESDEVRQAAGEALAKFGKDAVPPLVQILKGDNAQARLRAATSLGEIGADAKDAVPHLKDLYLAKNSDGAHHYALMLGKIGKPAVSALESGFKDARPEIRQFASQALQQMGAEAVGVLVDALGDKNVEVRRLAAQTLWPMRIGDKSVVIALAYGLTDEDDFVRQNCMTGLAQLGPQAKLAAPKLKEALVDMNPQVRNQAYSLLLQLGEDLKATLANALTSKDSKVRINTACLMVSMGHSDRQNAMAVLLAGLSDKDLGLKMQAAFTLASTGLHKDQVQPIFLDGLTHKSPGVRIQALQGFGMMRGADPALAPKVAEMLRDPDANVRQQAVYAFNNIPGTAETMVPILTKIYHDGDAGVRRMVLQVVPRYQAKSKGLITEGLKDKDNGVRMQAVGALQNVPGDLTEFVPVMAELLKDKELAGYRFQLIWMLTRAGDAGLSPLADLLKDSDEGLRQQAMQTLRNIGKRAEKVLPQIKEATRDKNANVRLNAMMAVATLSKEGAEFLAKQFQEEKDANIRASLVQSLAYSGQQKLAFSLVGAAMKDPAVEVRRVTVQLIGNFGSGPPEMFEIFSLGMKDSSNEIRTTAASYGSYFGNKCWPVLEDSLKSTKDSSLRQGILQSMVNTQYRGKVSVPPLIDCLKDTNPTVRSWACVILGNIGPDAADALPVLRKLAKDANPTVQNSSRNAVAQIDRKK